MGLFDFLKSSKSSVSADSHKSSKDLPTAYVDAINLILMNRKRYMLF